jgi:alanine dehydrogenase
VVIGAIHSKSGRTPILVTEEMVSKMKDGAVIIDVSIDQGGCIETSQTDYAWRIQAYIKHGVIHYCVPNIASKSQSYSITSRQQYHYLTIVTKNGWRAPLSIISYMKTRGSDTDVTPTKAV